MGEAVNKLPSMDGLRIRNSEFQCLFLEAMKQSLLFQGKNLGLVIYSTYHEFPQDFVIAMAIWPPVIQVSWPNRLMHLNLPQQTACGAFAQQCGAYVHQISTFEHLGVLN